LYRYVRRPTVRGVRCVIVRGDDALLVRHTYGDRRWAWPGGLVRRREDPAATARREVREELGLDLVEWEPLGQLDYRGSDRARHLVSCFLAQAGPEEPRPRRAEIEEVRWAPLNAVPADTLDGTTEIARRALQARG
jgi:ADP-ribose pyrophosphatase YjhB (NUDIX family)